MARINWVHIVLVVILALVVLFAIRMHRAAGQTAGQTIAQDDGRRAIPAAFVKPCPIDPGQQCYADRRDNFYCVGNCVAEIRAIKSQMTGMT